MEYNFYLESPFYDPKYILRSCANCEVRGNCGSIVGKDWGMTWMDHARCGCHYYQNAEIFKCEQKRAKETKAAKVEPEPQVQEPEVTKIPLTTPIKGLGPSVRLKTLLESMECNTLADVLSIPAINFKRTIGFGPKSFYELDAILKREGYRIGELV